MHWDNLRRLILVGVLGACTGTKSPGPGPDPAAPDAPVTPIAPDSSVDADLPVGTCEITQVPNPVSFSADVYKYVNQVAVCTECHSGGGVGKDLGGLMLDAGAQKTYNELTQEISPNSGTVRVNLQDPPSSMLLRLPSGDAPHPIAVFHDTTDLCYQTLLQWIAAGAKYD
jgi:hypothetical protein